MKSYGLIVVLALMLSQLMLLPTRSLRFFANYRGFSGSQLGTATNGSKSNHCGPGMELSWMGNDSWVDERGMQIQSDKLESYLQEFGERCDDLGYLGSVRARIPANASARHLVELTKCMERAGIENLSVAVVEPELTWH